MISKLKLTNPIIQTAIKGNINDRIYSTKLNLPNLTSTQKMTYDQKSKSTQKSTIKWNDQTITDPQFSIW